MEAIITKRSLKKDVFRLVSGIENEESALKECLSILGIKHKSTLERRSKYSPAEQAAIEDIFAKYGVTTNIWADVN